MYNHSQQCEKKMYNNLYSKHYQKIGKCSNSKWSWICAKTLKLNFLMQKITYFIICKIPNSVRVKAILLPCSRYKHTNIRYHINRKIKSILYSILITSRIGAHHNTAIVILTWESPDPLYISRFKRYLTFSLGIAAGSHQNVLRNNEKKDLRFDWSFHLKWIYLQLCLNLFLSGMDMWNNLEQYGIVHIFITIYFFGRLPEIRAKVSMYQSELDMETSLSMHYLSTKKPV